MGKSLTKEGDVFSLALSPPGDPPRGSPSSPDGGCSSAGFQWSGCSDNLAYGIAFSQAFVDNPEKSRGVSSSQALMNLHNNEAGRKVSAGARSGKQVQLLGLLPGWALLSPTPLSRGAVWGGGVCTLLPFSSRSH